MQKAVEEAAAQEMDAAKAAGSDSKDSVTYKYICVIVLPTCTPVSTVAFFKSLKDLTPVGCVMPSGFAKEITNTGWSSMRVDQWAKWHDVGVGTDEDLHPHLLRLSVWQACRASPSSSCG